MSLFEPVERKISLNLNSAYIIFMITGLVGGYTSAIASYFSIKNDIDNIKYTLEIKQEFQEKEFNWMKQSIHRIETILENKHAKPNAI